MMMMMVIAMMMMMVVEVVEVAVSVVRIHPPSQQFQQQPQYRESSAAVEKLAPTYILRT